MYCPQFTKMSGRCLSGIPRRLWKWSHGPYPGICLMIQKQDPSSSMQRLGNVEGWRLDTIQDFLCKLAMKPQMNLLEISNFFSLYHVIVRPKGFFFRKVRFVFQISKSPKQFTPNHYPELEIWISCSLLWAGISDFKFSIVIWSNFFWRFEKRIALSEKKNL